MHRSDAARRIVRIQVEAGWFFAGRRPVRRRLPGRHHVRLRQHAHDGPRSDVTGHDVRGGRSHPDPGQPEHPVPCKLILKFQLVLVCF